MPEVGATGSVQEQQQQKPFTLKLIRNSQRNPLSTFMLLQRLRELYEATIPTFGVDNLKTVIQ